MQVISSNLLLDIVIIKFMHVTHRFGRKEFAISQANAEVLSTCSHKIPKSDLITAVKFENSMGAQELGGVD